MKVLLLYMSMCFWRKHFESYCHKPQLPWALEVKIDNSCTSMWYSTLNPPMKLVMLTSGLVSRSEDFHFMVWRWSRFRCSAEAVSVAGRLLILGVSFLLKNSLCLSWFMLVTTFCSLYLEQTNKLISSFEYICKVCSDLGSPKASYSLCVWMILAAETFPFPNM